MNNPHLNRLYNISEVWLSFTMAAAWGAIGEPRCHLTELNLDGWDVLVKIPWKFCFFALFTTKDTAFSEKFYGWLCIVYKLYSHDEFAYT